MSHRLSLLHDELDRDDSRTADDVTQGVLRLFGMTLAQARRLCSNPLPDLSALDDDNHGSAVETYSP